MKRGVKKEMKVNPLLVFSNVYDCEPVINALHKINADILCVNYYKYPYNWLIGDKYFKEHPEYTHYIPIAPDLVPNPDEFEIMRKYVQEFDFDVYGPCCNVDMEREKDYLATCLKLPELEYNKRHYKWLAESQRQFLLSKNVTILDVKFNALCAPFIKRKIKLDIPFTKLPYPTTEKPIWETEFKSGYASDLAFCHFCNYRQVPIKQDLRFKWLHLRYNGELQIGKKEPNVFLLKNNEYTPIEIDLREYVTQ